ncbi:unnamed protein product, partial [marine sediment metagenome]
ARRILVVEPHIDKLPLELANQTGVELTGLEEGLEKADILVLLVDHQAFKEIDWSALRGKVVLGAVGYKNIGILSNLVGEG